MSVLHRFPDDFPFEMPERFTDPFRYVPHAAVQHAASLVIKHIDSDPALAEAFSEGKMLGVLLCSSPEKEGGAAPEGGKVDTCRNDKTLSYLAAFSGNVGGQSTIDGFVPPIYDLMDPEGDFKRREAEITRINHQIRSILEDKAYIALEEQLIESFKKKEEELEKMKAAMAESKAEREKLRQTTDDPSVLAGLIRKSQFEKAEFKRLKSSWDKKLSQLRIPYDEQTAKIEQLTKLRASMSDSLQRWIFQQYRVHNALGEDLSIGEIFGRQNLTPPGGTGECAAPKLLEYAYRNGLIPLAMGEFWYGKPSETAVRTHGRFYPSCTSKCGPLLGYMLKGLELDHLTLPEALSEACSDLEGTRTKGNLDKPLIIYEDSSIIVVEKPGGMPSVPGLDGRLSLQEWLTEHFCKTLSKGLQPEIHAVHRLDMDTSGVMIFAKSQEAAVKLRQQFESRSVRKTYLARLCPSPENCNLLSAGDKGTIELPLSPDYDERPRQKVDSIQGKPAHTDYKVTAINADGTIDLLLYPHTGRTHQLRVHCAHHLGLDHPILGDMLYGGHEAAELLQTATCIHHENSPQKVNRLYLHALSITFTHPQTSETLTFTASRYSFSGA